MVFSQFFSLLMPALLITMSRRPNVSTVLWNASVPQKQRGVSEKLQKLERHRTLSRKLRVRLNQKASLWHFEKKRETRSVTVHNLHTIGSALSFPLVALQTQWYYKRCCTVGQTTKRIFICRLFLFIRCLNHVPPNQMMSKHTTSEYQSNRL